ncbi:hypothetical protein [Sinorhizobium fredii]
MENSELRNWFTRQRSRTFTYQETVLQCVVALAYVDRRRPTVRELWHELLVLIDEDARMMPERSPMRRPSYSTFRNRIADLPREAVWMTRNGRRPTSFAASAMRFQSAVPEAI